MRERFPRESEFYLNLVSRFPFPDYNRNTDGPEDPAEWVLCSMWAQSSDKLGELCNKHALETGGTWEDKIYRLYLHWKSHRQRIGFPHFGYGLGFESTRTPTCTCGFARADWGDDRVRFPRLAMENRIRFPRVEG